MRVSLLRTLKNRGQSDLLSLHDIWIGGEAPGKSQDLLEVLQGRMTSGPATASVFSRLDGAASPVFESMIALSGKTLHFDEIKKRAHRVGISATAVRGALADLVFVGLIANLSIRHDGVTSTVWGVPTEIAAAFRSLEQKDGPSKALFQLRGFLEGMMAGEGLAGDPAEGQVDRMFGFLADESAVLARVAELPKTVHAVFTEMVHQHGGIISLRKLSKISKVPADQICEALEDASLGTSGYLNLEPYGLRQRGRVVTVFQEVMAAWFSSQATQGEIQPSDEASIGVDFVSNFDRFANYVDDEVIRFTARGTIFKSTGKRLAERLIPNPGREFGKLEILEMEYRFALAFHLIDRTGERTFRVTDAGKNFLSSGLHEKQRMMLDCLVEDRDMPGDLRHQIQMRRIALGFLKRMTPNLWYDAMALAYVSRHFYLASLQLNAQEGEHGEFPLRSSADLESLVWNLFTWIRKHLYLIGFIDLGYEENGRASGIRLTEIGAEFLGMIPIQELAGAGHIVVNPDFEIVFFPGKGAHALIYEFDRFCEREKSEHLYHYRLTPAALHRALTEGMSLDDVLATLQKYSRTPIPQNIEFSLESWAKSGGMVTWYTQTGELTCASPEILDRIESHPKLGKLGLKRTDSTALILQSKGDVEEITGWIQDYGVSVRLRGATA
jgi:hypothetical protein